MVPTIATPAVPSVTPLGIPPTDPTAAPPNAAPSNAASTTAALTTAPLAAPIDTTHEITDTIRVASLPFNPTSSSASTPSTSSPTAFMPAPRRSGRISHKSSRFTDAMIVEEPTTNEQAIDSADYDKWQLGMMEEYQSIVDADV